MHHHRGGEERRQKVEQRHGEKCRDDEAGQEHRAGVFAAQRLGLRFRPEAHRGEFEELAAEQIAVDQEECADVDARHEQQQQRDQVADDDDGEEFQRQHHGLQDRHGLARRVERIGGALDGLGDIVEEQPGDDRRHRRDQQGKAERQADAGDDGRDEAEPARPGRQAGQQRVDPGQRQPVEKLLQPEPQGDERQQRQAKRLDEDGAELGREELAGSGAGGVEDHAQGFRLSSRQIG